MADKTFGLTKQQVRIIDVIILAPFIFWASTKTENKIAKQGLIITATLTFLYNGINYIKEK